MIARIDEFKGAWRALCKQFSNDCKAKVALEAVKGDRSAVDILAVADADHSR